MIYLGSALILILIFVFDHLYVKESHKRKELEETLSKKEDKLLKLYKDIDKLTIENKNLKEKVDILTNKKDNPYNNPYDFAEGVLKGVINIE